MDIFADIKCFSKIINLKLNNKAFLDFLKLTIHSIFLNYSHTETHFSVKHKMCFEKAKTLSTIFFEKRKDMFLI